MIYPDGTSVSYEYYVLDPLIVVSDREGKDVVFLGSIGAEISFDIYTYEDTISE